MTAELAFGPDFVWGVSTSAYQIEGAVTEAGRGPSTWDTFCAEPGRILNGDTGAVACDHFHRYAEDVALMQRLGVDVYRFSFSWPRVQPGGKGLGNGAGLDFYDRLIDELLAAGIKPAPTLFHWDTPQELEDEGGWLNRDIADRFADYATILAERFADRVPLWMTINEPMVLTLIGYAVGGHAPGKQLSFEALPVAHHQLLAHGRAVQALRAGGASNIGIASNHAPTWPASDSAEDVEAAGLYDNLINWMFSDPILLGEYPAGIGDGMPGPVAEDLEIISTPIDWFGLNHYAPARVGAPTGNPDTAATDGIPIPAGLPFEPRALEGYAKTDFGWPIVPEAFGEILRTFKNRYGDRLPPIYITENGCAINDEPVDGVVADQRRIDYLDSYLHSLKSAIDDGVDVRGYFQWSLLDNFEWSVGYSQRFGLIHVDYETLERTPKASYHWYRDLIARHRP
ncbi:GH1 family beta-glucosidase [Kribbella sp. CA-293567]|uniref:GH1 family beta-glucosidase n=1 Tax=Kribbella sp. CA-293567 TaxID=3002436 RepID=UPI0022DD9D58|nr:GH1 family beta-glucosidase [Kribbella sp. CA-293567]WBQ04505.1 GH1 family beta-glucosidase [Kribbella sp. CA-293567]